MRQFLITVAGVFVGLLLFAVGVPLALFAGAAASSTPVVGAHTVLRLDLREPLTDQTQPGFLGLGRGGRSVMSVVQALHAAENDPRVRALYVRLPEGSLDPAAADELRGAFQRFRQAGKTIVVHSQGIYPGGAVISTYEVAAAASEVWMQPASSFQVTGLATEEIFLRRLFDRFGVIPDFQQRREYKNAINGYLYSDFTPAHREAELSWMTSIYESAIAAAAADRHVTPQALRATLEAGPYSAEQALALHLIDRVGDEHQAEQSILASAGATGDMLEIDDYEGPPSRLTGPAIAVISAEGEIQTGTTEHASPFSGQTGIYSDDVARAFYRAIRDRDVRAIVFRVSSPGGSDTASEQILTAMRAATAAGKPVVVSMGSYAASGGYWISSGASAIVAQPTTLTGSIGVYGGRFALGPALARQGVDVRPIGVGGGYAQGFGVGAPMNATQSAAFSAWMDQIYEGFVARVAAGRHLPVERVREIARGRVWTGAQARDLRLVDEVGGFYQAVARARQLARLSGDVRLKHVSGTGPLSSFARFFGAGADSAEALSRIAAISRDPEAQALLRQVGEARARASGQGAVLSPTPNFGR